MRRLCHFGVIFSFWDEVVILGWTCHSGPNLSFCKEFIILGWHCHSGLICYSGLVSFWDMFIAFWADFVILGRSCVSWLILSFRDEFVKPDCSFLLECLCWISHPEQKLSFWVQFVILKGDLSFWAQLLMNIICYSGLVRPIWEFWTDFVFWFEYVTLTWVCHSDHTRPNWHCGLN